VALFEFEQHVILERFYGAGEKQAARAGECRKGICVAEQVLDFYCYVVGELWMLGVQRFNDTRGVGDAVEEIGIAEGDVFRAGCDLLADIGRCLQPREDSV
jgi:hypothetical protein